MQAALDAYLAEFNTRWPHQCRGMKWRTPLKAFNGGIPKTVKKEDETDQKIAA